jgi:hypothetical protein
MFGLDYSQDQQLALQLIADPQSHTYIPHQFFI